MRKGLTEQKFAWMIIAPAMIIVFGIVILPLIETLIDSIKDMNLTSVHKGQFVGISNYIKVLSNSGFWATLGRTAYFSIISIAIEMVLGVLIALLLNENFIGNKFLRTIIIIPWAIPTIVNGAMWKWIYNPDYGALNGLLSQLHIISHYHSWLGSPWVAMNLIIIADTWKMTPLVVIFFLASLQLTNQSVYEAAIVDGAGIFRRFFSITLPYLKPTILVILVIRTMETFKVFDLIYVTTGGGPANGTMVLTYKAYLKAFENLDYSAGATYSYLIAIMIALLTLVYVKLLKREENK